MKYTIQNKEGRLLRPAFTAFPIIVSVFLKKTNQSIIIQNVSSTTCVIDLAAFFFDSRVARFHSNFPFVLTLFVFGFVCCFFADFSFFAASYFCFFYLFFFLFLVSFFLKFCWFFFGGFMFVYISCLSAFAFHRCPFSIMNARCGAFSNRCSPFCARFFSFF